MKSFRNKDTGAILTPQNEWVEEQLAKNDEYIEVKAKSDKADKSAKSDKAE